MAANEVLNSIDLTTVSQISYGVRVVWNGKTLDLATVNRSITPVYS